MNLSETQSQGEQTEAIHAKSLDAYARMCYSNYNHVKLPTFDLPFTTSSSGCTIRGKHPMSE